MALHGEIKVNGHIIGYWEATRSEEYQIGQEIYSYECRVTFQESGPKNSEDPYGPPKDPEDYRFELKHRFADGALVLMIKVIQTAQQMRTT